jgi:hypothetical protein
MMAATFSLPGRTRFAINQTKAMQDRYAIAMGSRAAHAF